MNELIMKNGYYSSRSKKFDWSFWNLWLKFLILISLCNCSYANSLENFNFGQRNLESSSGAFVNRQPNQRPLGGNQPNVPLGTSGQQLPQPKINDVSVVCASNSITGQFAFNSPFYGKIYSSRYANVHDCVYYNTYGESTIMFTIPNYKCGTMIQRNSQNIISHIENEVYVQFDKETQNAEDRRFLFVCDRVSDGTSSFLSSPHQPSPATFKGTIQPGQTIIVQTIEPTRVLATDIFTRYPESGTFPVTGPGNTVQPYVWMEIQDGSGPGKPPVQRPLRLGEQVTLVVTGRSSSPGNQYDMFVHSCFASDGSGQNKIQLTDQSGCTLKSTVAGKMARQKNGSEVVYYVPLKAFKFPNSDDVYFSCAVEVCSTCYFPELCPSGTAAPSRSRRKAQLVGLSRYENNSESIQVHDYVRILDNTDTQAYRRDTQSQNNLRDISSSDCFSRSIVIALLIITAILLTALMCVSIYAMYLLRQRKKK